MKAVTQVYKELDLQREIISHFTNLTSADTNLPIILQYYLWIHSQECDSVIYPILISYRNSILSLRSI